MLIGVSGLFRGGGGANVGTLLFVPSELRTYLQVGGVLSRKGRTSKAADLKLHGL